MPKLHLKDIQSMHVKFFDDRCKIVLCPIHFQISKPELMHLIYEKLLRKAINLRKQSNKTSGPSSIFPNTPKSTRDLPRWLTTINSHNGNKGRNRRTPKFVKPNSLITSFCFFVRCIWLNNDLQNKWNNLCNDIFSKYFSYSV